MSMKPLDGVTVLALEQAVAAPFATRQLADLGARVIKIERPKDGDFARNYDETVHGQSSHFIWLNRSKESICLNLKHPSARRVIEKLVLRSDVFIQNLAPGALGRLGFTEEFLKEIKPNLVICNISGYGNDGPYSSKKAYDLLIQCEAGLMSITGTEEIPSKAGISIADIAAGMYAYSGILTALFRRERTSSGAVINVSMLEALGEWMGFPAYFTNYGGQPPLRTGASHATIFPYGPFTAGDGKTIFIGIQNEREWDLFCSQVLVKPELGKDEKFSLNSRRVTNRKTLLKIIEDCFSHITSDILIKRLDEAKIASARLNSIEEFWNHPQLKARQRWRTVETPKGDVQALIPPATLDNYEPVMSGVPALGSSTESILQELGFSADSIISLKTDGAL